MYDTVRLCSPQISESDYLRLLMICDKKTSQNMENGDIRYELYFGQLEGSFDNRVSIQPRDYVYENIDGMPKKIKAPWHYILEFSIHKFLIGHNVTGNPDKLKPCLKYIFEIMNKDIPLAPLDEHKLLKIDVAIVYQFTDKKIALKVIENSRNLYYTRRKPIVYDTSIMFVGSTNTIKLYHKGSEFKKHDSKRLLKFANKKLDQLKAEDRQHYYDMVSDIEYLQKKADNSVRFELSINVRAINKLFKDPTIKNIDDDVLGKYTNQEMAKLFKNNEDIELIERSDLVLEKLLKENGNLLGNSVYATYTKLCQFGEKSVKETMNRKTLYRHKKILAECNIRIDSKAVDLRKLSIVPSDFTFMGSKYRNEEKDPFISYIEKTYADEMAEIEKKEIC